MASVSITPTKLIFDGEDITTQVVAYRLEAVTGDVPMLVLELKPGIVGSSVIFAGVANVRIAEEGPSPLEFLQAIDASILSEQVLNEGDAGTDPFATALDILKRLAQQTQP